MQFSVIIPNYNHAPFLRERIDSVLAQTNPEFELIILDDASTDNSRDIIESFRTHSRVSHIVYNETNSGSPFRQWKKGIDLAQGEWIWIAESDDMASPGFLEEGASFINNNPSVNLFYSDAGFTESRIESKGKKKFSDLKNHLFQTKKWSADYVVNGKNEISECLGFHCTINNASSALLRKEAVESALDRLEAFRFHGDWFCYLWLAARGDIAYSCKQLNMHRVFTSGLQSLLPEGGKDKTECFRILEFIHSQVPVIQQRSLVRKFVQLHLDSGLIRERKEWSKYFGINKKLARKVVFEMIRKRIITGNKKKA